MKQIAIIGGGAAGLAAAVGGGPISGRAQVTVYEMDARVGRRILVTGNGRCNFSNTHVSADAYYNAEFVATIRASTWQWLGIYDSFENLGLVWVEEADGRLLPATGKASTVVDVLRARMAAHGIRECCDARVVKLLPPTKKCDLWTLKLADGRFERADAVIVTTGGQDALLFLPEDIVYTPFVPVLGPLKTDTTFIRGLDNIRVRCTVSLMRGGACVTKERGELLFRKYGVSGICVFNLSRFAVAGDMLSIDLAPDTDEDELCAALAERLRLLRHFEPDASTKDLFRGMFLPSVTEALCRVAGIGADSCADDLQEVQLRIFAETIKRFALRVEGIAEPAQCQVHRGGVAVSEVDELLAHKRYPGLFFAGEALDVDGPCGGYNLHWAWVSGMHAAMSAYLYLFRREINE